MILLLLLLPDGRLESLRAPADALGLTFELISVYDASPFSSNFLRLLFIAELELEVEVVTAVAKVLECELWWLLIEPGPDLASDSYDERGLINSA